MKNIYIYILIVAVLVIGIVALRPNVRSGENEEQTVSDQVETTDTSSVEEENMDAPLSTENGTVSPKPVGTNTKPTPIPASTSQPTLSSKTWTWVSATYSNSRMIKPLSADSFTMTLRGGTFTATTDCNTFGGVYISQGFLVTFSDIAGTEKFCEGSLESDFTRLLLDTYTYHFTSKGLLVLSLKNNAGTALFK